MPESLLNSDELLAPISESKPTGTNYDTGEDAALGAAFSNLRSLVSVARKIESTRFNLPGMHPNDRRKVLADNAGADGPQADPKWGRIAELSVEILTKYSKDTRVLVNLIEAMMRLNGFPGLREALSVCADVMEKYGLSVFPEPESASEPYFALQFFRLMTESESNNLKQAIYQAEIFRDKDRFCWYSYITATGLEKRTPKEKTEFVEAGAVTLEDFAQVQLGIEDLTALTAFESQVAECLDQANRFDKVLSDLSKSMTGLGNLQGYLSQVLRWYRGLTEDRMKALRALQPPEQGLVSQEQVDAPGNRIAVATSRAGSIESMSIVNREQALASLLRVASYFRETEPHSPVSYALEQAVRWGKLPLPELLRDLVSDENVLSQVFRRMGIQDPS